MAVLGLLILLVPFGLIYGLGTGPPEMWWFLFWYLLIFGGGGWLFVSWREGGLVFKLYDWYQSRPLTKRQTLRIIRRDFKRAERDIKRILLTPEQVERAWRWLAVVLVETALSVVVLSIYISANPTIPTAWLVCLTVCMANSLALGLLSDRVLAEAPQQ